MGNPIDRTNKTALDGNLVNGITSDAPKVKANNDVLYNYVDTLNQQDSDHASASVLAHPDGSVTTAKLADGSVTSSKLAAGAIASTANLADGIVTTAKLADIGVTAAKIANGAVTADKVATGSLTADKFVPSALSNDTQNGLLIGALSGSMLPNLPIPEKTGIKTRSPKLVICGSTNDQVKVAQYIGNKYAFYKFESGTVDTSTASVGGSSQLIRLLKATLASMVYVAKNSYDTASTVGTITTLYAPSLRNSLEDQLVYNMGNEDTASFESSSGNGYGLGLCGINNSSAASSVTWKVNVGSNRKANIMVYGSSGSSASADILVNGEVVKSFDPTKLVLSSNNHYKIIEFEIPERVDISSTVNVTLRNNDTAGKTLYFSCVNFMWLKDYDGRDVDFYKIFNTSSKWIDAGGSSDYAIFDHDLQKWCGSYHGGETRITAKMIWTSSTSWAPAKQWNEGRIAMTDRTSISAGWAIYPTFRMMQVTDINSKGTMLSIFDFDIDGTIQMDFSFYNGTINVEKFYTALTATHVSLNWIKYPRYEALPTSGSATSYYFDPNEGSIQQYDATDRTALGIRFTRFQNNYRKDSLKNNGWIYNDPTYYKKFYYGYAEDYTSGLSVKSIQFRKALDFIYE